MNSTFLTASPEFLQAVFDNSLTNIYAAQAIRDTTTGQITDFQLTLTNPAFRQRVGFSDETIRSNTLLTLFSEFTQSNLFAVYVQVVETGDSYRGEEYYPSRNTNRNWFDISVTKLADGVVVNFIDITDYKQAREQARQSAEMIETLVDNVPLAISLLSPLRASEPDSPITDWVFERVNRAAAQLRGLPVETMEGRFYSTLFPEATANGGIAFMNDILTTGQTQQYDLEYRADGLNGWFDQRSVPIGNQLIMITQDITDRKRVEQQVQQTNSLLQSIINGIETGVNVLSPVYDTAGTLIDFRYELVNATVSRYVGRQPDDLTGMNVSDWFVDYFDNGNFEVYRRVYETQQPEQFDQHYVGDGQDVWISLSARRIDANLLVTFTDFTGKKQTQQQVQQQADQLQATLDASISSILAMTAIRNKAGDIVDFRMDRANRSVERSLGRTPAELEGRTLLEVFPGNVESGFFALYAKAADTGEPQQTTQHYTDVNGYEGWFEASAVRHETDKIVLTFMNVTESKQQEQQLHQQADLVNSVLNATLTAVATYVPVRDEAGQIIDFRFTLANQASLDMLGLPPEALYTKTLCDLNPSLRNSEALTQYVNVVRTGKPVAMERQIGRRWYLVSAVRFNQDDLLTSSIDITETKLAHEQIEQINSQLRRTNESLDQFASVASHDLQEPLRKIQSFGDLLADQYGPQLGDGLALLQRMQSATARMQTLIRDLLAYARLSKGSQLDHRRIDLNALVRDVLQDLELSVSEKNAQLHIGDLPTLPGDALQLQQVFQNLLSNALKFSKPGQPSHITVTARAIARKSLPLTLSLGQPAYWEITVSDNGIGFNEQYRERIFGAFERLHGKSSLYSGTGIGLAIVRRVMENHAGAVTASSTEGQGATFRLYFPVQL